MIAKKQAPPLIISEENGFTLLTTEGISSKVFLREKKIYKINSRNSLKRQRSDFDQLKKILAAHAGHLPETEIVSCFYEEQEQTCVIQPYLQGIELKKLGKEKLFELLKKETLGNKLFLETLLTYFFTAIEQEELYPDPVGQPDDPDFFNSVNLILDEFTGKIILCDVGLSPHEDTLVRHGKKFYQGENVTRYVREMKIFHELLTQMWSGKCAQMGSVFKSQI